MPNLGWSELLVIGIVALIVVGPKDLPGLFRATGRFMGKARGMAREFSRAMESAAEESGLKDVEKTFRAAANPRAFGTDAIKSALKTGEDKPGSAKTGAEAKPLSKERAETKAKMDEKAAELVKAREAKIAAAAASEAAELSDEPEVEDPPAAETSEDKT